MDFLHTEQELLEKDISGKQNEEAQSKCNAAPLNSIDRIRAAERKAEESISSAHSEAVLIIDDAKKTAKSIIEDGDKAAKDTEASSIVEIQQVSRGLMDKLNAELDVELQALKNAAMSRMAKTVELMHRAMV